MNVRRSAVFVCCLLALGGPASTLRAAPFSPRTGTAALNPPATDPQALLKQLLDERPSRRREALLSLTDLGAAGGAQVSAIWPVVRDPDPLVRAYAARALWLVGNRPDAAVPVLSELVQPAQPTVCALAAYLLGEIGPAARPALGALAGCLSVSDSVLRLHAAEAIVKIDPADAVAHRVLLQSLESGASEARYFAACALLSAGAGYASPVEAALSRAMTDDDLKLASAAALSRACRRADFQSARSDGRIENPSYEYEDAAALAELGLLTGQLADPHPLVRRQAALQLAQRGVAARPAQNVLRERLDDDDPLVRAWSACALWALAGDAGLVLPTLLDLVGTAPPNVTTLAVAVLAEMGPEAEDALPALYDLLDTSAALPRLQAATALSRIDPRGREAVLCLSQALQSDDSDLRYLAALSLGQVSLPHRKRAERDLTAALADRNLRVRAASARALAMLAEQRDRRAEVRAAEVRGTEDRETERGRDRETEVRSGQAIEDRGSKSEDRNITVARSVPFDPRSTIYDPRSSGVPVAQAAEPQLTPPAEPEHHPGWYDRDEETLEEHKPIGQLRARINPPEGDFPIDHATPHFAQYPTLVHGYGTTRGFVPSNWSWEPTALCYNPLWFQDINLERYGWHYGCLQTAVSAVKFTTECALLPYKLVAESPCDCVYTLGYDRPGNCVPYRCYRLPWRSDAAVFLGGVATGLVFLAP